MSEMFHAARLGSTGAVRRPRRADNGSGARGLVELGALGAREGEAELFEYPAVMYGRTV